MNKVEGKENLFKDPNSGAVINGDTASYKMAKHFKQRILQEQKEKKELEDRVENVEAMLKQLMEKGSYQ